MPLLSLVYQEIATKCFYGSLKSYFKKEPPGCKITRYRMAHLTALAWSKFASVGVGVCLSQPVFTLSTATVCLNICSDTSETVTSMETVPPDMSLVLFPLNQ